MISPALVEYRQKAGQTIVGFGGCARREAQATPRYNRDVLRAILLIGATIALTGCAKNIQNNEAVRQGVVNHLSKRTDLAVASMDIQVSSVSFRGNEADAMVSFKPKNMEGEGMQMRYTLERKGNEWVVKSKADSGAAASPHEGEGAAPRRELPPDHPPMGSGTPPGKKQ